MNRIQKAILDIMATGQKSSLEIIHALKKQGFWLVRFRVYLALSHLEKNGKIDHKVQPCVCTVNDRVYQVDQHLYRRAA